MPLSKESLISPSLIDKKNSEPPDNINIEKYRQHFRRNILNETKNIINFGISLTGIVSS